MSKFKIKLTDWEVLSLRVIGLFVTAMLVSYSPQFLRGFFADTMYDAEKLRYSFGRGFIDDQWDWGFRHYLYFWMCVTLFVIQAVKIIKWANKRSNSSNSFPVDTKDDE